MKNNKGFTIVEVIVVAVIVMILSAVAIPMYGSYITSARQSVVDNLAETAATAANNVWRRMKQADGDVDDADVQTMVDEGTLRIHFDNEKHRITVNNGEICVEDINHGVENGGSVTNRCVPYRN